VLPPRNYHIYCCTLRGHVMKSVARCFLGQETSPSLLSTGWFQEMIQA